MSVLFRFNGVRGGTPQPPPTGPWNPSTSCDGLSSLALLRYGRYGRYADVDQALPAEYNVRPGNHLNPHFVKEDQVR